MDVRGYFDPKLKHKNINCLNSKEMLEAFSSTNNQIDYLQNGYNALDLAEHYFRCGVEVLQQSENDQFFSILSRSLLALVFSRKGQWGEALITGEKAFQDSLSQGGVLASICEMVLAAILMEKGHPKEAKERVENSAALIIGMGRKVSLENSVQVKFQYSNDQKKEEYGKNNGAVSQKEENSYLFRIQMFGPFRVFYREQEIDGTSWRTVKSRDLLAYLAHQDKPISTDQILEDLWPNVEPNKSSALFHTTLYYLRRLLQQYTDEEIIIRGSKRYQLRPGSVLIDRCQFEDRAQKTIKKTMTTALASELEAIAALYRGDYLEDLDYQWVISIQEELRNINSDLKQRLAVYYLKNKMYSRALVHLRQIMVKNPYSEEVLRLLLTTLTEMGELSSAREQYTVFTHTISEELGLQPSSEIKDFYTKLCEANHRSKRICEFDKGKTLAVDDSFVL